MRVYLTIKGTDVSLNSFDISGIFTGDAIFDLPPIYPSGFIKRELQYGDIQTDNFSEIPGFNEANTEYFVLYIKDTISDMFYCECAGDIYFKEVTIAQNSNRNFDFTAIVDLDLCDLYKKYLEA